MVDLHCHILPGIDDGASTMEDSLAMAESAIEDGITHVVATPHSSSEYYFDFARVRRLRDDLQSRIGDRLQLATGCDFHLQADNIEDALAHPEKYTIDHGRYLLVEFPGFSGLASADEVFRRLIDTGMTPIVTHPERNPRLQHRFGDIARWIGLGCLVQVTAGSHMGLSCGNPTATANLRPGEVVVDLGCGGGIDVLLAAKKVGPAGRAIGIYMTPEMIDRARAKVEQIKPGSTLPRGKKKAASL